MISNIELSDKELSIKYPGILEILLMDRTTKKNLIFATNNYVSKGHYEKDYIDYNSLIYPKKSLIRPRIEKSKVEQKKRSKDMAEVFTPSWICNNQNNLIDNEWFGFEGSFNFEDDEKWNTTDKVTFKDKKWEDYVDLERLEITCGEAPYLVSRYDAVNGEQIEPHNRIGLLDRKLRVISENTENKDDFIKYSCLAYKRIYGFDFQGDNVLLARKNLFFDFIEFYLDKFNKEPDLKSLKSICTIIIWNIWQMDGLTDTVPLGKPFVEQEQLGLNLFEEENEEQKPSAWTDEQLAEMPSSPKRLLTWIEDRYMITEAAEGKRAALKENNFYCPVKKDTRCMCTDFKEYCGECTCAGGVYKKTIRDEDAFLKMRKASFKRGE